jgi:hypothetical protein
LVWFCIRAYDYDFRSFRCRLKRIFFRTQQPLPFCTPRSRVFPGDKTGFVVVLFRCFFNECGWFRC